MIKMKREWDKHAQVTIFVIIGIMIIFIGILIFFLFPKIQQTLGFGETNPSKFIQDCMENKIKESVNSIELHGGSINPENYYNYKGDKIEYLCYREEHFLPCVVQQPLLKQHIEQEIKINIHNDLKTCIKNMEDSFRKRGYTVQTSEGEFNVELLPKKISITANSSLILNEFEEVQKFDNIKFSVNSDLYELISIANSIINWEATYGDAETTTYMNYYHNLKVEKLKQSDETTIYIITNRETGEKFQFASRSMAWAPGYGGGDVI